MVVINRIKLRAPVWLPLALVAALLLQAPAVAAVTLQGKGAPAGTAELRVVSTVVQQREGDELVTTSGRYSLQGVVEADKRAVEERDQWSGTRVHLSFRRGELVRATFY